MAKANDSSRPDRFGHRKYCAQSNAARELIESATELVIQFLQSRGTPIGPTLKKSTASWNSVGVAPR